MKKYIDTAFPRWLRTAALALAMALGLAAPQAMGAGGDKPGVFPEETFNSIQRELICLCGCKSILKDCPHVDCGYAIPLRKKIQEALEQGQTRQQIIADVVRERGEEALAAPKKEGFNIVGYVLPALAILAAGFVVAIIAKNWAARGAGARPSAEPGEEKPPAKGPAAAPLGDEMAERLKKELEEFDS